MHIVTYDSEKHGTLGEAVDGDNSLAVIGTLFKVCTNNLDWYTLKTASNHSQAFILTLSWLQHHLIWLPKYG